MNISGILVVAHPDRLSHCIDSLLALPGVELHHQDAGTGKLIVTLEAESVDAEVEGLKRIKAVPDAILAEMVYHYLGEDTPQAASAPSDAGCEECTPIA